MASDIVERLRIAAKKIVADGVVMYEAAREIERLRAALEYYAGRHNYIGRIDQLDGKAYPSAVIVDNGNMARAALAQEKPCSSS